ncbi:hypothetical protein NHX12_003334 [Muraenolepis orangiensis]|uniref:exodeoxyribonuclease III n=1 Tax=Muraenolepis orangiensis TaxID=630683 RepID=A0A9Q0IFP9_9TELE|nr:hypothetical protein NHX12_003334 [Muraenolepis orangiensis]
MLDIMLHHSPEVVNSMTSELSNVNQSLAFFDLETTGFGKTCEIVQLAAVSGGNSINLYTVPGCRMQSGAAKVTGFRVRRHRLFLNRQPVLTNSLREVVVSFIAFLRMLGRPILIGHNIRRFDCPVLVRALDQLDLRVEFQSTVTGCLDTLPLARDICKDYGFRSFRQENLVRELLGLDYDAHNALEDVRALQSLYWTLRPTSELISRHSFTLETMVQCKHISKTDTDISKAPSQSSPRCGST